MSEQLEIATLKRYNARLKVEVERLTEELTLAKQLQAKYMTPQVKRAMARKVKKDLRSYGIR